LHLDCCFQPVGHDKAIVYPQGFIDPATYDCLQNFFGQNNLYVLDKNGLYEMYTNILSLRPDLVISDPSFVALNQWLRSNGIEVIPVDYHEVSKQGGLFRCTTLPLIRKP
jgi:N-dimethylarginine dimethylaminohydrolase